MLLTMHFLPPYLTSLFLYLFFLFLIYSEPSIHFSASVPSSPFLSPACLSVSLCFHPSLCFSHSLSIFLSLTLCLYLSLSLTLCLYLSLSLTLCFYLSPTTSPSIVFPLTFSLILCFFLLSLFSIHIFFTLLFSLFQVVDDEFYKVLDVPTNASTSEIKKGMENPL